MYRLNQVKLNVNHSESDFKNKIAKLIRVSVDDIDWSTLIILHKSIDARDKSNILFVYNIAFDFASVNSKPVGADIIHPPVGSNLKFAVANSKPVGAGAIRPPVGANLRVLEKYESTKFNPRIVGDDILSSHAETRDLTPKTVGANIIS